LHTELRNTEILSPKLLLQVFDYLKDTGTILCCVVYHSSALFKVNCCLLILV